MDLKTKIKSFIPDEYFLKHKFSKSMGYKISLKNPRTFSEKMQWLKLYDRREIYTTMVDKYKAKRFVAGKLGDDIIIPTLGVWESFEHIDFERLPTSFVLKCTHDSGGLIICKDKKDLDVEKARQKLTTSLKHNYYYNSREWPYKNVQPRILAEEYLENDSNEGLHDYKVWCFNGEPVYIQYISGRLGDTTEAFYDLNWNKQSFSYHNPLTDEDIPRPDKLQDIISASKKLSQDIAFLRCDFYITESGDVKFGELTFYPMAGFEHWHPEDMDLKMGAMIDLSKVKASDKPQEN